jgi:short subunit dehydrogenase-like uncharacterized protein
LQWACDFGAGERSTTVVSWPDVFTAFYTTGIPNITAYLEANVFEQFFYAFGGQLAGFLQESLWSALLKAQAELFPEGPSEDARQGNTHATVAEAVNRTGQRVRSRLRTPEVYTFTSMTALLIVEKILAGNFTPGVQTPARVYGADFVLALDCVIREDLDA